jgi:hypothetical protein
MQDQLGSANDALELGMFDIMRYDEEVVTRDLALTTVDS